MRRREKGVRKMTTCGVIWTSVFVVLAAVALVVGAAVGRRGEGSLRSLRSVEMTEEGRSVENGKCGKVGLNRRADIRGEGELPNGQERPAWAVDPYERGIVSGIRYEMGMEAESEAVKFRTADACFAICTAKAQVGEKAMEWAGFAPDEREAADAYFRKELACVLAEQLLAAEGILFVQAGDELRAKIKVMTGPN